MNNTEQKSIQKLIILRNQPVERTAMSKGVHKMNNQ